MRRQQSTMRQCDWCGWHVLGQLSRRRNCVSSDQQDAYNEAGQFILEKRKGKPFRNSKCKRWKCKAKSVTD